MTGETHVELLRIAQLMDQLAVMATQERIKEPLQGLNKAAEETGRAWSGSWIGYHANTYFRDLQPKPPGEHFSQEWGKGSPNVWIEFDREFVLEAIDDAAGRPDIEHAISFNEEATEEFRSHKSTMYSILEIEQEDSGSSFLLRIMEETDKLAIQTWQEIVRSQMPKAVTSRDSLAFNQGIWTPPHISVIARVESIRHTAYIAMRLGKLARQAEAHISRRRSQQRGNAEAGTIVFIGHGHSKSWLELKDFIQSRLKLPVDEFNRVSTAGVSNVYRLAEMIESAAFAFLVLTGEDEQSTGGLHPRMNVVHEAGLFQGRLGFERAIVILEDGCEEFSNIAGLGQLRFQKDNIKSVFEEVRMVLEREGVLETDE